jgi:hypothetical protein
MLKQKKIENDILSSELENSEKSLSKSEKKFSDLSAQTSSLQIQFQNQAKRLETTLFELKQTSKVAMRKM